MFGFITAGRYNRIVEQYDRQEKLLGITLQALENHTIAVTGSNKCKYTTREEQVRGVRSKYQGKDSFGNQLVQRIVNLRVAFSVPNRLFMCEKYNVDDKDTTIKDTKEFLKLFMEVNKLDHALPRDLAKESELHGQVLVVLKWDEKEKVPVLYYYPTTSSGMHIADGDTYKSGPGVSYIIGAETPFSVNTKLKAYLKIDGEQKVIRDEEFCFIKFNDELSSFEGYPTCGGILTTIENLDKDLKDWRELNHLFAHPTPHFQCETQDEAIAIRDMIKSMGWKVGSAIATNGQFNLKGTTGVETQLLMMSITTNAKVVSGHCGIGIHFLGFANVMSNRATADSMGEPTEVVLHSEISLWERFYQQMFDKAILMRNAKLNRELPVGVLVPKIVPITDRQYAVVKNLYLPLVDDGLMSHKTLLDNLPLVDAEEEMERIKYEEKAKASKKPGDSGKSGDDNSGDGSDMGDMENDEDLESEIDSSGKGKIGMKNKKVDDSEE